MGGIPCRLFFACGRLKHGRCPRLVPTVLPLPLTSYLDESEVIVKRGTRPLEVRSPGAFLCSPLLWLGNLPPRATAQLIGASYVETIIARTVSYVAMS